MNDPKVSSCGEVSMPIISMPIKRGTCRCGCGRSLKDTGQCRKCRRSLECCDNPKARGSCAYKYAGLDAAAKHRSDAARDGWERRMDYLRGYGPKKGANVR